MIYAGVVKNMCPQNVHKMKLRTMIFTNRRRDSKSNINISLHKNRPLTDMRPPYFLSEELFLAGKQLLPIQTGNLHDFILIFSNIKIFNICSLAIRTIVQTST